MSNLWNRIFGKRTDALRTKSQLAKRRALRVENLEHRHLLANDFGVIAGQAFTDLTDDGLTGDDTALVGAQIRLFKDGGNGTFDNGAGDDVESVAPATASPQTTDASGNYRFEGLDAGTYFVVQDAFTGRIQRAVQTVQTVTISAAQAAGSPVQTIDSFDATTQISTADNSGTNPNSDATDASEAIGGERDFFVQVTSVGAGDQVELRADTGGTTDLLTFESSSGATGTRIVTYDGDDNDGATLDPTGLGGIDLTTSGAAAFRFEAASQPNTDVTIRVFTDGANSSSATITIPDNGTGALDGTLFSVDFADFTVLTGSGADFANVGAIQLEFVAGAAGDGQLDQFETIGPSLQTINFANLNPLSLGNLVFRDNDNNGLFDGSDSGIDGVSLQLFNDVDSNGAYTDGVDVLVSGTGITNPDTTAGGGIYTFDNLFPGNYVILIADGQAALTGFQTSTGNDPASDPDDDVDSDDNGTVVAGFGIASAAITLASGAEPTGGNTNNTLDFGFAPEIDLGIVKTARDTADTADLTDLPAGQQVIYRLTVTNNGPQTAENVEINDLLPAGVTLDASNLPGGTVTSAPDTVDPTRTRVVGTLASLASGATVVMDLTVTIDAAATGNLLNESDVAGDGIDTDPTNDDSDLTLPVDRVAVLQITKTDTPDPVAAGADITYTVVVTNQGPSTATNVVIDDPDLADVTFSSPTLVISNPTAAVGSVNITADAVQATIPTLEVGQVATVTFVGTVAAGFTGTTITNTATANADEATLVTTDEDTSVARNVDLLVTKTGPATAVAGNNITYTFSVENDGPGTSSGATVTDILPTGLSFVSSGDENGVTGTFDATSGQVTFALPDLASGAAPITFTMVVGIDPDAPTSITNDADIVAGTGETDTDPTNNNDDAVTTVNREFDLSVTKDDGITTVNAGGTTTYTIVVTNDATSTSTATNVTLNDPQVSGLTITSASSSDAGVVVSAPAAGTTDPLTATIASLAPGASVTITVNATVDQTARGTIANVVTVAAAAGQTDTDTTNNSDTDTNTITTDVVLTIDKRDSVDPIVAGNQLTYTIDVGNTGTTTATGVQFSDTLPAGVTFVSGSFNVPGGSSGQVTNNNGTITASMGNLASNITGTVTILVNVDGTTRGTITNNAQVTSTEVTTPVTDAETTTVNANVDVSITKAESADPVAPGETLTYTLVIRNNGTSIARNVQFTDNVPTQLTVNSVSTTVGTATNAGNSVSGTIGDLAAGQQATVTITTTVNAGAQQQVTNTANVTTDDTETSTTNNSASVQTLLAATSTINGRVYVDANGNGQFDTGEEPIAGVTITLTGTDFLGGSVTRSLQTDAEGEYSFDDLLPGTYTVRQTQPSSTDFTDGEETAGSNGSTVTANDEFTVNLQGGVTSAANNFGETVNDFSKRRFLSSRF